MAGILLTIGILALGVLLAADAMRTDWTQSMVDDVGPPGRPQGRHAAAGNNERVAQLERDDDAAGCLVVAITDGADGEGLLTQAAELAERGRLRLIAVHVRSPRVAPDAAAAAVRHRTVRDLGGDLHEIESGDFARALVATARQEGATELAVGASPPSGLERLLHRTPVDGVLRLAGDLHVHVLAAGGAAEGRGRRWHRDSRRSGLAR